MSTSSGCAGAYGSCSTLGRSIEPSADQFIKTLEAMTVVEATGKTRAYARGQLRTCPNMADCTRRKARLVAYRKRFSPATELNWYTRLRYKTAAGKYTLKLPVPSH